MVFVFGPFLPRHVIANQPGLFNFTDDCRIVKLDNISDSDVKKLVMIMVIGQVAKPYPVERAPIRRRSRDPGRRAAPERDGPPVMPIYRCISIDLAGVTITEVGYERGIRDQETIGSAVAECQAWNVPDIAEIDDDRARRLLRLSRIVGPKWKHPLESQNFCPSIIRRIDLRVEGEAMPARGRDFPLDAPRPLPLVRHG